MSASTLYDFENNLAGVFASGLVLQGFTVLTANTPDQMQKQRPRIELLFKPSGAITPVEITPASSRAISAYRGDLMMKLITGSTGMQKDDHSAYRSAVRAAMELDVIRTSINPNSAVYSINFVIPGPSGQTLRYQDGYEVTDMNYRVDFSIRADAWSLLSAP